MDPYYYFRAPVRSTWTEVVTSLSPTAWWRLGEASGTVAVDEIGAVNGTYTNSPTLGVAGMTPDGDTAVTFSSASTQYVSVPDNAIWDLGTADFSFVVGFSCSSWPATRQYLLLRGNGAGTGDWGFYPYEGTTDDFRLVIVNTQYTFNDTLASYAGSGFHLLGVSVDRTANATLYIDGVSYDTVDISVQSTTSLSSGTRVFGIAANAHDVANSLNGTVDEVILFGGTLLTAEQHADLAAAL